MATRDIIGVLEDGSAPDPRLAPLDPRTPIRITQHSTLLVQLSIVRRNGVPVRVDGTTSCSLVVRRYSSQTSNDIRVVGVLAPRRGPNCYDFVIAASATSRLTPARYVYDIWLTLAGERHPVVPLSAFYLEPGLQSA